MNKKTEENSVVQFLTNEGVEIKMVKKNRKYHILVLDSVKKNAKSKKVFESLSTDKSMQEFFKYCNHFTKKIK
jgi:hypothetical protein|tara:strand:+ start:8569 stop:8787 length:219 start_codon:yes stop_codon:yes gene_type:complete